MHRSVGERRPALGGDRSALAARAEALDAMTFPLPGLSDPRHQLLTGPSKPIAPVVPREPVALVDPDRRQTIEHDPDAEDSTEPVVSGRERQGRRKPRAPFRERQRDPNARRAGALVDRHVVARTEIGETDGRELELARGRSRRRAPFASINRSRSTTKHGTGSRRAGSATRRASAFRPRVRIR